ncbi:MAG TPA: diacylglycerol kinase, partial [Desulfuromonadales bacterium]|nr:diacylglycerol kinase [Desulfuromonadales bacterium]
MKDPERMKPANWFESVNCAIEGIIWSVRTQRHMRYHFWAAAAILLVGLFFHLSALELILLILAVTFVLFAELFNTAIEVLVDLVSPEYHPLARRAKDVAAGAVFIASIGAVVLGY